MSLKEHALSAHHDSAIDNLVLTGYHTHNLLAQKKGTLTQINSWQDELGRVDLYQIQRRNSERFDSFVTASELTRVYRWDSSSSTQYKQPFDPAQDLSATWKQSARPSAATF
jgi:hypothetical protein